MSTSIIDEFIVTLGLDDKGFKEGMKRAVALKKSFDESISKAYAFISEQNKKEIAENKEKTKIAIQSGKDKIKAEIERDKNLTKVKIAEKSEATKAEIAKGKERVSAFTARKKAELSESKQAMATEEKQKQEAEKKDKERQKKSTDGFRLMKKQIIGIFALLAGGVGLKRFVTSSISEALVSGQMSKNLGMSVKQMLGWQRAAENLGGTAQGMQSTIAGAAGTVASYRLGTKTPQLETFLHYGGSVDNGELDTTKSFLLAEAALINKITRSSGRQTAFNIAQRMGLNPASFNLMEQGAKKVKAQVDAQSKLVALNDKTEAQSRKLTESYNTAKNAIKGISRSILFDLTPVFNKLIEALKQFAVWLKNNKELITSWTKEGASVIGSMVTALGGVKGVLMWLSAWKAAGLLIGLAEILKAMKLLQAQSILMSKKNWLFAAAAAGFAGYQYVKSHKFSMPKGIINPYKYSWAANLAPSTRSKSLRHFAGADNSKKVTITNLNVTAKTDNPDGFASAINDSINSILLVNSNSGVF